MQNDFSWQRIHDGVSSLSRGLLLSTTDNAFIVKDLQNNTVLQILPFVDFISEYCKYSREIFSSIGRKLSRSSCHKIIFYDSLASEKISQLCESNRLLF